MSTTPTSVPKPDEPTPSRLVLSGVLIALGVLALLAAITLSALDATATPDLPGPLVINIGTVGATAAVIGTVLACLYHGQRASARNTRLVLDDTGEIPRLVEHAREPEIIIVRESVRYEQVDRDRAMRVVHDAERRGAPMAQRTEKRPEGYSWGLYSEILTDVLEDLGGVGRDVEGPDSVR